MSRKWFSIAALIVTATSLLVGSSCGDSQELVSIAIVPSTETVGAANIPLTQDTGFQVQLSAQGTYVHSAGHERHYQPGHVDIQYPANVYRQLDGPANGYWSGMWGRHCFRISDHQLG